MTNSDSWEKDCDNAEMVIEEVGMTAYDWFWDCMEVLNNWASLMDVWFKVERQFGENTDEGVKKANEICESLKRVVTEEMGDGFWDVDA